MTRLDELLSAWLSTIHRLIDRHRPPSHSRRQNSRRQKRIRAFGRERRPPLFLSNQETSSLAAAEDQPPGLLRGIGVVGMH